VSSKPWAVILHASFEGPGLIEEVGRQRGIEFVHVRSYAGEPIPDYHDLAGVISMGGPMGVGDAEDIPALETEMGLLWVAVDQGLPVLGVCLGAQLLAAALGADVTTGRYQENGCGAVVLTQEGVEDPVLGPAGETIPVLHWHRDTFGIPKGAVRLAYTSAYRNQAFRVGTKAYGFQFHVELTPELVAGFTPHFPYGVAVGDDELGRIASAGRGIFERFFNVALDA
jgi:GMP synthase-like glutamine amidotransferase